MRKLTKSELIDRFNQMEKIKFFQDLYIIDVVKLEKVAYEIVLNNGYRLYAGNINTNPFKKQAFLDKHYGRDNLTIWLKINRPHLTIVDEDLLIYQNTKIKLYSTEWNMECTLSLEEILNFKTPRKSYDTSSITKSLISEEEFNKRVKEHLKNDCYKSYKLISDYSDYEGSSTRMIFKHNTEGWLVARKFVDLALNKEMIIFNSHTPELSTLNMKKYLNKHMKHITLKEGQIFTKKQSQYTLTCKFHGDFEVDWNNFYCRRQDCPHCVKETHSKGEVMVAEILNKYNVSYKKELTFKDFKSKKGGRYRFDFGIYKNDILVGVIEYHGEQHYNQYYGFFDGRLSEIQERDLIKKNYILNIAKIKYLEVRYNEANKERLIRNFLETL